MTAPAASSNFRPLAILVLARTAARARLRHGGETGLDNVSDPSLLLLSAGNIRRPVPKWGLEVTRSPGETQLLSLSFMLAMTAISDVEAPLVIDTPLARLDKRVRSNLLQSLPGLTRQLVLLVTDSEMDSSLRPIIDSSVGDDYLITFENGESTSQQRYVQLMAKIAIDLEQHEFYRQLSGRSDDPADGCIFSTVKDVFIVCVGLGARNGNPLPLKKRVEIFEPSLFSAPEWAALEAIYVGFRKDIDGLKGQPGDARSNDAVNHLAEELANAGMVILRANFDPRSAEVDLAYLLLSAPT